MALRIEAIASYCGLKGIFKLRAADIYEVVAIQLAPETMGAPAEDSVDRDIRAAAQAPVFTLKAMQDLALRIQRADCLEALVDSILEGLDDIFGFKHGMILVPSEEPHTLVTIATRGYPAGAGAEVRFGEGIAGLVAEARKPIRISGLLRGMLYAYAMHHGHPDALREARRIPMPGLANPESQLGVPLLVRGELVGVLVLESEVRYRFHEEDKMSVELLGNYLAIAIQNVQLQEAAAPNEPANTGPPPVAVSSECRHELVYYGADEVVMIDGEYLIRNLPARILWRLLTTRATSGRDEFTNRELRLDKSLNLPEWKDNLESRLILLRRRLEQKCPDIRITPTGRGRFRLAVDCQLSLSTRP
jgi:hypothetical protein